MTRRGRRTDAGMVTAETAVALPALVVVLVFALWSVTAVTAQLRCVDAARIGARALARGDAPASAVAAARAAAPEGARVVVSRSGDLVVVDVLAATRLPGRWSGLLPGVALSGRAVASIEGDLTTGGGTFP